MAQSLIGLICFLTVLTTKGKKSFDELFQLELVKYKSIAKFTQLVQLKSNSHIIEGIIEYVPCDGQKCLPPEDVNFKINIHD